MDNQDQSQAPVTEAADAPKTELSLLKDRARMMGMTFSNNITLETLKAKVEAKMAEDDQAEAEQENQEAEQDAPADDGSDAITPALPKRTAAQQLRVDLHDEQMKLVRCRITCMNPAKSDLHGEIFTVANEYVGTVRKFIPFGEATDNGYHLPFILYQMLEERRFQHISTFKDPKNGQIRTRTRDQKEFSIEVLPQLTEKELRDLSVAQIAAGSIENAQDGDVLS